MRKQPLSLLKACGEVAGRRRGFAIRFHGADRDVNIATAEPEFRVWAWMAQDELIGRIVPFKRDTYTRVFAEFADLF